MQNKIINIWAWLGLALFVLILFISYLSAHNQYTMCGEAYNIGVRSYCPSTYSELFIYLFWNFKFIILSGFTFALIPWIIKYKKQKNVDPNKTPTI